MILRLLRTATLPAILSIATVLLPQAVAQAPSSPLESLGFKFKVAKTELDKPLEEFNAKYEASLKELGARVRQAGKLDQALAVETELEGYAAGTTKPADDFPELNRLRKIYANQSARIVEVRKDKLKRLLEAYGKQLNQLEIDLTKANQLAEAVKVREAAKKAAEQLLELDAPRKEPPAATGRSGKLFAFGNFYQGELPSLATAEKFDDFVQVRPAGAYDWVALRSNGKVVTKTFPEVTQFRKKIAKLGSGEHLNGLFGIDSRDQVEIARGRDTVMPSRDIENKLRNIVDITRGGIEIDHLMALTADGEVLVWGSAYEQPGAKPPPERALKEVRCISTWSDICYVAKKDGSVISWIAGKNEIPVPDHIKDVASLAIGGYFGMALTDSGEVLVWGNNTHGECEIPKDLGKCVEIRASNFTAAAKKENGIWVAWGDNTNGIVDKINSLGSVVDLAFKAASNAQPPYGYLLWIKPEN